MHGVIFAALLTSGIATLVFGIAIHRLRLPADERLLWLAALVALPLQPLTFAFVRVPMDAWLVAQLGPESHAYAWLTTLYAPLTEEPAKLIPLLVPAIFRDIRRDNFTRYALAIGTGFAIGEIWFLADRITHVPELADVPVHQFGGYMTERLMACVFHAAFVAVALSHVHGQFALGVAGAVALHWLVNMPMSLMAWNVGGLGRPMWMIIVLCFLVFAFFAALALLSSFAFGRVTPAGLFYGPRHCPECAAEYDAPLLALNFFRIRYERCPHCRRWHWTQSCSVESHDIRDK